MRERQIKTEAGEVGEIGEVGDVGRLAMPPTFQPSNLHMPIRPSLRKVNLPTLQPSGSFVFLSSRPGPALRHRRAPAPPLDRPRRRRARAPRPCPARTAAPRLTESRGAAAPAPRGPALGLARCAPRRRARPAARPRCRPRCLFILFLNLDSEIYFLHY